MLVLTRRVDESICIGDDIEVRVVEVRGGKVRLAIEAPRSVNVRRKELPARAEDRLRLGKRVDDGHGDEHNEDERQARRRAVS